jgi:branched-chain amino acid transport system ATP-binding protein
MLNIERINVFHGEAHILYDLSLEVKDGETVCLLGRNGAGKTTTLRSIMGLTPARTGKIIFRGNDITRVLTHEISNLGVGWVPDNRRIFPTLTVEKNLLIAKKKDQREGWDLKRIYEHFPQLTSLRTRKGEYLSGGEQQMLAIARTLMGNPQLVLLDEPSEGLAPMIVKEVMRIIQGLRETNISILLVEQNSVMALQVSNQCYIIDGGRIVHQSSAKELDENLQLKRNLLGI